MKKELTKKWDIIAFQYQVLDLIISTKSYKLVRHYLLATYKRNKLHQLTNNDSPYIEDRNTMVYNGNAKVDTEL